jgi:hypothetical protein
LFQLVGLKSYFIQSCGPSTASAICHHDGDDNGEGDTHVQHDNGEEDALVQEDSGEEDNGPEVKGIITEFNPNHIISDLRLHIPIDHFVPNIREKLERLSWLKVHLVISFLNQMIKEVFRVIEESIG